MISLISSSGAPISRATVLLHIISRRPEILCSGVVDEHTNAAEHVNDVPQVGTLVVSRCATIALRPCERTSSAVASAPASSSCQVIPMSIPAIVKATTVALPMPESEPVTMALRG
jgi:hypothetical protein